MRLVPNPAADIDPIEGEFDLFRNDELTLEDIDYMVEREQEAFDYRMLLAEAEERDAYYDHESGAW